ncbi:peptide chain release factor N(5)-glutamine methyltransferase [Virgibacillus xinjiangensis]|uniref:Release factor glutamine methyltransferase n=1 Tax=Virgibacillus xinjiangensis TaxID=393090 RepID=A0ABV7CT45_9BACI
MSRKQYEVLQWASSFLEANNREARVAEILLQHHLGLTRTEFLMQMREPLPDDVVAALEQDVDKHVETGVPVQHLTGYEVFWGREFTVNPHVLIPRPETEELIQHILRTNQMERPVIVDAGTGSGVIAITLALELEHAEVYATDISPQALETAKTNAANLEADVHFLQGDFLKPVLDQGIKADIIVSNPPYISEAEADDLSDTVRNFDPELALFAEEQGLAAYQKLASQADVLLSQGGLLVFEIGHQQGEAVQQIIKGNFPPAETAVIQDINGKDRIVTATIK